MGHPGGERERSEAAEQHITRRADLLFQVMVMMVMVMVMVGKPYTNHVEKHIIRRADLLFQVMVITMRIQKCALLLKVSTYMRLAAT